MCIKYFYIHPIHNVSNLIQLGIATEKSLYFFIFMFIFLRKYTDENQSNKLNFPAFSSDLTFHPGPKKKKSKKSYLTRHLESERIAIIFTTYREGNQGPDFRRIRFRIYQYQNDVGFQTGKSRARTIRLHCFPPQRI